MVDSGRMSRRGFLGHGAAAAGAGLLAGPGLLAKPGDSPGANERINIAFIGVGRRGRQLMGEVPALARIVAVCDVDRTRAEAAAAKAGCKAYADYRKVLDLKDVDAVVVATPDHWHALNCIHACQAGKDVYGEKPLGLTIREGRLMVEAARKYRRVFQVGTQRRSFREHILGCGLVRSGAIGKVHTVHSPNYPSPWECRFSGKPVPDGLDWDTWCGPVEPIPFHPDIYIQRSKPGWMSFRPFSGGEMTNTGAHGLDLIQWALGADDTGPTEIVASGGKLEPITYLDTEDGGRGNAHGSRGREITLRYASGVTLKLDNGALGGTFVGEKGTIVIDSGTVRSEPAEIVVEARQKLGDAKLPSHMQNWLDCIKSRQRPHADVEIGQRSATVCHLSNIARWVGRPLRWDPAKERFLGDDEANRHLDRPRRKRYELPDSV